MPVFSLSLFLSLPPRPSPSSTSSLIRSPPLQPLPVIRSTFRKEEPRDALGIRNLYSRNPRAPRDEERGKVSKGPGEGDGMGGGEGGPRDAQHVPAECLRERRSGRCRRNTKRHSSSRLLGRRTVAHVSRLQMTFDESLRCISISRTVRGRNSPRGSAGLCPAIINCGP